MLQRLDWTARMQGLRLVGVSLCAASEDIFYLLKSQFSELPH
jgi:hypothetical protein